MKMGSLRKPALLFAANLSLPTFQVITMDVNLGCDHCRYRVTQILSKMAGSKEFGVDICRKQVIVKGGIRFKNKVNYDDVLKRKTKDSSLARTVLKFIIKTFEFLWNTCPRPTNVVS